jgi:hypothetical protein
MFQQTSTIMQNAQAILGTLVQNNAMAGRSLTVEQLMLTAGLEEEEFWAADGFLLHAGHVEGTIGGLKALRYLTSRGVEFYELSKRQTPEVQIGAIFHGSVEHSQIQTMATAIDSAVQQVVRPSQSTDPSRAIWQLIEDMVAAVKPELDLDELASYAQAVQELREEIKKDTPDRTLLQRSLAVLSFLGDVEGSVALGERALQLAQLVAPYLPYLVGYLNQL